MACIACGHSKPPLFGFVKSNLELAALITRWKGKKFMFAQVTTSSSNLTFSTTNSYSACMETQESKFVRG
ncbi:hypothetical protein BpHYR1_041334, partial [Brachionus plicatilis]